MEFWILSDTPPFPEYHALIVGLLISPNGEIIASPFSTGKRIGKQSDSYKIKPNYFSKYGKYTDKLSVGVQGPEGLFVISNDLFDFLENRKVNAEFFDVKFIEYRDIPSKNYKIVNLLDVINCVDEKKSNLIYKDLTYTEIQSISFLALDKSKMNLRSEMFLLDKIAFPVIVVKDSLKIDLEKQGFQGLNFYKLDEFISL